MEQPQQDGKILWKSSCMQKSNTWVHLLIYLVFCHHTSLFTRRHFTRLSSPEGWAWITEHHCRDLCSVMFMAGELKSRKGLWECQQSRKEKTSLVPLASYIFSIRTSCASSQISRLCLFKYEEAPLMQPCSQSPSSLGIAVSGYFQEVLRSIKCEQIWQSCRGRGLICSKHAAVNNLNI